MKLVAAAALIVAGTLSFFACSSSSNNGSGSYPQCAAACEAGGKGCPQSDVSGCQEFCAFITPSCKAQEEAYATCTIGVGFKCSSFVKINDKPAAETVDSSKCQAELKAYADCQNAHAPKCSGSDDAGFCPSVDCACPSGHIPISGSRPDGHGGCTCVDTTTCKDFCH